MSNQRESVERLTANIAPDGKTFARVWVMLRPYRILLFSSMATLILFNSIGVVMPWMLKVSVDRILPNADYMLFLVLCGVMAVVYTIRSCLRYISSYITTYMGVRLIVDLRQKLFRHLQSLSLHFYEEYRTGKLISNVISDVSLLDALMRSMAQLGEHLFQLVVVSVLLMCINWQMGLIVLSTLPLHYMNFYFSRRALRKDSQMIQEKVSEISANLSETISGMRVVKAFARERAESRQFFTTMRPIVNLRMRQTVDSIGLWIVYDTIAILTYLSTIGIGIGYVRSGSITIGEFVAFYSYVTMLLTPINMLSSLTITFAQGLVGAARIMKILDTIPEIKDPPDPIHLGNVEGEIEFSHVKFSYPGQKDPAIKDFSLRIKPGQKVALVGPSGSGKSTIGNLLLRFYDIDSGAIKVDGVDIRKMSTESYRSNVGVVLQEPFLFSGTVRENIGYAKDNATAAEIEEVADMANVTQFVNRLPDGFNTVLGENGATLSGGQKQRLAIARAILKNPRILLLDEATSALDTVSEYLVQEALDRLMKNKTTIIIAHRLSTVKNADMIVVLDRGRVVQRGTHDELMRQSGLYYDLYQTQRKMVKEN